MTGKQEATAGPVLLLAAGDGRDGEALTAAAALAAGRGSELVILGIIEPLPHEDAISRALGLRRADIDTRREGELKAALEALAAAVPETGPPVRVDVRAGRLFIETVRAAEALGASVLVKHAADLGAGRHPLFASLDQHLLRKCPCAVFLVRPGAGAGPVLAAADVDEAAADEPGTLKALNQAIALHAGRTAAALGGAEPAVHLVHVWDAPEAGLVWQWADAKDGIETYLREAEAAQARLLAAFKAGTRRAFDAAGLGHVRLESHLTRGVAREAVPGQLTRIGAATLVMGTVARTGVPGILIGNTAEDILNSVGCSVLTVKPPGFRSPVR